MAFHSILKIFHSFPYLKSSIFHTKIPLPFHLPFHSIPLHALLVCRPRSHKTNNAGIYGASFHIFVYPENPSSTLKTPVLRLKNPEPKTSIKNPRSGGKNTGVGALPLFANCCYYLKSDQNIQRTARKDGCFTCVKCCCFTLNIILAASPSFYFTSRHWLR